MNKKAKDLNKLGTMYKVMNNIQSKEQGVI